jgi:hypothetical protein
MNPRIKELAEQCESFGSWDNKAYSFDKEKFAELIVKECIKVLETNNANLTSDAKWDTIYEIEQYFGVK